MKFSLLPLLLIMSMASFAQDKDELAVRKVLADQVIAWNKGDIEGFMEGYWNSDSLVFIGKSGVTRGWKNTINNYKKGYPDTIAMGKLSFDLLSVSPLSAEIYHVIGKWSLVRSIGNIGGHFTLLIRKISGRWLVVLDHTS